MRLTGMVAHGGAFRRAVQNARQVRDADAQVAIRAARQPFVEETGFQQNAEPTE